MEWISIWIGSNTTWRPSKESFLISFIICSAAAWRKILKLDSVSRRQPTMLIRTEWRLWWLGASNWSMMRRETPKRKWQQRNIIKVKQTLSIFQNRLSKNWWWSPLAVMPKKETTIQITQQNPRFRSHPLQVARFFPIKTGLVDHYGFSLIICSSFLTVKASCLDAFKASY